MAVSAALDFDPFKMPDGLLAWLAKQPGDVIEHHTKVYVQRAGAARFILYAVQQLRLAAEKVPDDGRIEMEVEGLLQLARDLHDYDPTSD